MAKHQSLPYRPALDGLRGVAVAVVVVFHVNKAWLPGGWLGVDLFFVLSGFLITSLLLTEHNRWGRISYPGFWAARARRLLPSLTLVLVAVLAASAVLAPIGRRSAIAGDVLSSVLYVANWRFLLGDEQYFATIAMPSPVRHMWSLSIEEQFYLLFPLLLSALLVIFRKRLHLTLAFAGLALLSLMWMAHLYVPGVDPSRVYYGTDTRIFELFIGAAAGALFGAHEFAPRGRWRTDRLLPILAWPALLILLLVIVVADEQAGWIWTGGLGVFAAVAVLPIVAAAAPESNQFQKALAFEPLRQLGLISYALYLWHWPVIVFTGPDLIASDVARAALQIALSVALAFVTYHCVERPIRRDGFSALIPSRPTLSRRLAWAAVPALALGLVGVTRSTATVSVTSSPSNSAQLAIPEYLAGPEVHNVVLLGNSVPASMMSSYDPQLYPDLRVTDVTSFGCEPFDNPRVIGSKPVQDSEGCRTFRKDWPEAVRAQKPDLVLMYMPQSMVSDRQVAGRTLAFGSDEWLRWLQSTLDGVHRNSAASGARHFAIMNLACHRQTNFGNNPEATLVNNDDRVTQLNQAVASWASKQHVPVIDQFKAFCTGGFHDQINGVQLYADGLHFTEDSGAVAWSWLVPQLQTIVESE